MGKVRLKRQQRDPWVHKLCDILRGIAYEQATRDCSGHVWGKQVIEELDQLEDAWNQRKL